MRAFFPLLAAAILAGCAPPPPASLPPVDFSTFGGPGDYDARREAELSGGADRTEAEILAAETRAALGRGAPFPIVNDSVSNAVEIPDLDRDNPGISREQDFDAVAAERDIADDAARLQAARQQYRLVQPTELQRPDDAAPNIIAYALNEARPRGAAGSYPRSVLSSERRSTSRCAGYRTPDVAQEAFLEAGGPARDRLGLDPDGDGNACAWDPSTFADLVRNR